jgi:hypothetical protein
MLDGYGRDLVDEEDDRKDKTRILASTAQVVAWINA